MQTRTRKLPANRVIVKVPGSTSNIGPGFDTLGLALDLHTTLSFELEENRRTKPLISLDEKLEGKLPVDESNLIYRLLCHLWKDRADLLERVNVEVKSGIPLTGGLGSSASATVGTVWAAYALTGKYIDRQQLLCEAAFFEGHPDNVAPSIYGGFTICSRAIRGRDILVQKLDWPENWCPLIVAPQYTVPTAKARALLPARIPYADAVCNVARVASLVSAVARKDESAFANSLIDSLHEPYRQSLVPELAQLKSLLTDMPVLGCVLSGAGSAILVLVARRHQLQVSALLNQWAAQLPAPPQVLNLSVAQCGIQQID